MAKNNQEIFSKTKLLRPSFILLSIFLFGVSTQPARANVVEDFITEAETTASYALQGVEYAWTQAQDQIKEGQTAWAATINGVGQSLQSRIATMTADTASANNRTNVQAKTAEDIAVKYGQPTSYNACAVAQAAAAGAEISKTNHAIAQAVANGGGNRPSTPAAVAADVNAEEKSGLAHCEPQNNVAIHQGGGTSSGTDTEASVDKALNCTVLYNTVWAGADETSSAIFDNYQFPIAQNLTAPVNGVYSTIPAPATELDMPFIAALSFCNHINDRLPPAPQAIKGHVTVDALAIDAYRDMKADVTNAYSVCIYDVFERTQYTNNAGVDPHFTSGNTNQATLCQADVTKGILDGIPTYQYYDPNGTNYANGTCTSLGRSELQAKFDHAWRDLTKNYQLIYLVGLTPDAKHADLNAADAEKRALDEYISNERSQLTSAITVAKESEKVYSSSLSQPITK